MTGGADERPVTDRRILLLSVALQLALGLLFGHSFDARVFMATGFLVGTGENPYAAQDLSAVFDHVGFDTLSAVGYPPPWPLVLGLLYLASYAVVPNLLLYNLALKLPVIAANVALAYLVAAILKDLGASPTVSRRAWTLTLFNPALLYFGAAWGQIDAIAAALAVSALLLLWRRRTASSAAMFALSVCVKPLALPVVPVAVLFLWWKGRRRALAFAGVLVAVAAAALVLPFALPRWDAAPILHHWNVHFTLTGGLGLSTVFRLWRDPLDLSGWWWLAGLVWIPALAVAVLALRRGDGGFEDLLSKATALVLVFFLTRARLAPPNVVLLVPLVLVLTTIGSLPRIANAALWAIPLAFALATFSPFDLLFPAFPGAMDSATSWAARYEEQSLYARAALVVLWQVTGWWMAIRCFATRRVTVET